MKHKRVIAGIAAVLMMFTPSLAKGSESGLVFQEESPEIGTGKYTIFGDLPEDKKMLPIRAAYVTYIEEKVNGIAEIVPCYYKTVEVQQLEQMQMPENLKKYPELEGCYVDMSMIPEDVKANSSFVTIYTDIVNGKIIGYLDDRDNYFGYENQFQNGEKVEYIYCSDIEGVLARFGINIKINEFGITDEILYNNMTIADFIQLFKHIIPRAYWPIQNKVKKYINTTLLELTEEELNRKIDKSNFDLFMFFSDKYTGKPSKVCFVEIVCEDTEDRKKGIYDITTGAYVCDLKGKKVDKGYSKELNPDKEKGFFGYNGYLNLMDTDEFSYLMEWLINAETVGDIVEAYQRLKPEYQIDYSFLKNEN